MRVEDRPRALQASEDVSPNGQYFLPLTFWINVSTPIEDSVKNDARMTYNSMIYILDKDA